jgi:hypothetical protein
MVLPALLVGHEKWKSSVLPLLFHPLADEVRPGVALHKMSELKAVAENRQVRLHRSHGFSICLGFNYFFRTVISLGTLLTMDLPHGEILEYERTRGR